MKLVWSLNFGADLSFSGDADTCLLGSYSGAFETFTWNMWVRWGGQVWNEATQWLFYYGADGV